MENSSYTEYYWNRTQTDTRAPAYCSQTVSYKYDRLNWSENVFVACGASARKYRIFHKDKTTTHLIQTVTKYRAQTAFVWWNWMYVFAQLSRFHRCKAVPGSGWYRLQCQPDHGQSINSSRYRCKWNGIERERERGLENAIKVRCAARCSYYRAKCMVNR